MSIVTLIVFLIFCGAVIVGIILIQQGQRRIPVQYAKRVVGRKMYGGQATHIPLKVNQAGNSRNLCHGLPAVPADHYILHECSGDAAMWVEKWLVSASPREYGYMRHLMHCLLCSFYLLLYFGYF